MVFSKCLPFDEELLAVPGCFEDAPSDPHFKIFRINAIQKNRENLTPKHFADSFV